MALFCMVAKQIFTLFFHQKVCKKSEIFLEFSLNRQLFMRMASPRPLSRWELSGSLFQGEPKWETAGVFHACSYWLLTVTLWPIRTLLEAGQFAITDAPRKRTIGTVKGLAHTFIPRSRTWDLSEAEATLSQLSHPGPIYLVCFYSYENVFLFLLRERNAVFYGMIDGTKRRW